MKLSISKAWEETSAFLGREARLVAPVALATFALPAILAGWAYPGEATGGGAGWLLIVVMFAALIGQMTIVLLVNGWRGKIGEAMGKAARRLPTLLGALIIAFLPVMKSTKSCRSASEGSRSMRLPAAWLKWTSQGFSKGFGWTRWWNVSGSRE